MKFNLIPVRSDDHLSAEVMGEVLTLNGTSFDLSGVSAASPLIVSSQWIVGEVTRDEVGNIALSLILPHGPNAPDETRFPEMIEAEDGALPLPDWE